MLSAMGFLREYSDRKAQSTSLNFGIFFAVAGPFIFCMGFSDLLKYVTRGDSLYLFVGPIMMLAGSLWIVLGVVLIHAVVRRLVRAARDSGNVE
jgi:hypothetical protein